MQPTFESVFTYENLMQAAKECCANVRWKASVQNFELFMSYYVYKLYEALHSGTYRQKGFITFDIVERGKKRHIQAIHITDRCVQKCLCNYGLKPILTPKLIYDNGANLKGKGTDFTLNRLKQHLVSHYKKYGNQGGILLLDFSNYFGSIPHQQLLNLLRNDIKDDKLYNITKYFISTFKGEYGLGLGSEISQILAVYYPNKLDHFIKEQLYIDFYGRYMDDSYIIHNNIQYLFKYKKQIEQKCNDFGLVLNPKSKIVPLSHTFVFLKKRISYTETGKVIMQITTQNVKNQRQRLKKLIKQKYPIQESLMQWYGYATHYNSYTYGENLINDILKRRNCNVIQQR